MLEILHLQMCFVKQSDSAKHQPELSRCLNLPLWKRFLNLKIQGLLEAEIFKGFFTLWKYLQSFVLENHSVLMYFGFGVFLASCVFDFENNI